MARIRNKMDADLFACARDVGARRAYVVFHVARTEDAAGIDVFKTSNHFMRRLACRMDHHVQTAAVTHGHDGFEHGALESIMAMSHRGRLNVMDSSAPCSP